MRVVAWQTWEIDKEPERTCFLWRTLDVEAGAGSEADANWCTRELERELVWG